MTLHIESVIPPTIETPSFWVVFRKFILDLLLGKPEYAISFIFIFLTGYVLFFFCHEKIKDISLTYNFEIWDKLIWSVVFSIINFCFSILMILIVFGFVELLLPSGVKFNLLSDVLWLYVALFLSLLILPFSIALHRVRVSKRVELEILWRVFYFLSIGLFVSFTYINVYEKFVLGEREGYIFLGIWFLFIFSTLWIGDEIKLAETEEDKEKKYTINNLIYDVYIKRLKVLLYSIFELYQKIVAFLKHPLQSIKSNIKSHINNIRKIRKEIRKKYF